MHDCPRDIGVAGVVFQTATADGVFGFQHHGSFDFWGVFDFPHCREEFSHQLEDPLPDGGHIDTDVLHAIFLGEACDFLGLIGKVHAVPLVALKHAEFATGHRSDGELAQYQAAKNAESETAA